MIACHAPSLKSNLRIVLSIAGHVLVASPGSFGGLLRGAFGGRAHMGASSQMLAETLLKADFQTRSIYDLTTRIWNTSKNSIDVFQIHTSRIRAFKVPVCCIFTAENPNGLSPFISTLETDVVAQPAFIQPFDFSFAELAAARDCTYGRGSILIPSNTYNSITSI